MPIQRHESLRSLSRDHHVALLLARAVQSDASPQLRAGVPKEPRALADHVSRVFRDEIDAHFLTEENVLLPAIKGRDPALDAIWKEIETEHRELRSLASLLADPTSDGAALARTLDRFGRLLESHVHKEERSFYHRIQEALDPAAIESLGAKLERQVTSAPARTSTR